MLLITGLVVALTGLAITVTGSAWGIGVMVIGGVVEVSGPYLHDCGHRQRGEVTHALWGENDRNKLRWLSRRA
jgi:hypothetical protein